MAPDARQAPAPGTGHRIAGAAALIAGLTIAARLAGFARIVVFSRAVGKTNLGEVYQAANTIPNIIFEVVAGGALAALVVPLLAGAIARDDRRAVGATASALLTWVLVLLVPLAVVVAVAAHPIMWLLDSNGSAAEIAVGTSMLRVFAPQLPLYGIGIVLTGVLQAHRRFAWPVLAPLLSSVMVMAAYALFAVVESPGLDIPQVSTGGQLILSVGTTLGVVVLSLCLVPPVRRLGLRWRPTLRFDPQAGAAVRGLAGVGVITVVAQQLALVLTIVLANLSPDPGTLVVFTQAQTIYLLPWAVLAVPVATSVYPVLATAFATGEKTRFDRTLAGATRSVLLLAALGGAGLVALAEPVGMLFARVTAGHPSASELAAGIIGFAPGLLGYGLFALHSRALYARGQNRSVAIAALVGWSAVALASVLLAGTLPTGSRVAALTWANSIGMVLLGGVLLAAVRRRVGTAALAGAGRAGGAALLAGTLAALAGIAVRLPLDGGRGYINIVLTGVLSGIVVIAVFAGVLLLTDRQDARPLLARVRRRLATRPGPSVDGGLPTGPGLAAGTGPGEVPEPDEGRLLNEGGDR